jgi:hypothetical protein
MTTTTSGLAQRVLQAPALPLRVQIIKRLSDDLHAAIADAAFAPADVALLDASLQKVLNGWSLSVSRFLSVQDDVELVLTRAMVGRPLVERVLGDLEDVFLALWNHPGAMSSPASGHDRLDS